MDAWTATLFVLSNILTLFIGFMLGDENHHEEMAIREENDFNRHVHSAMWAARRDLAE